ncbi:MAG: hypothetical protein HFI50_12600 [Lachnospiraceae bacterium]|jgi:cytochrome c biogenesis protein CcdA|nr:hypothetical protein [Lachnospiraceae bacterium]
MSYMILAGKYWVSKYLILAANYLVLAAISYEDIQTALKTVVYILGGGVALMGVIDAFSGYSNQSSGKQSEGIIKAIGGAGIILVGSQLLNAIFAGLG